MFIVAAFSIGLAASAAITVAVTQPRHNQVQERPSAPRSRPVRIPSQVPQVSTTATEVC